MKKNSREYASKNIFPLESREFTEGGKRHLDLRANGWSVAIIRGGEVIIHADMEIYRDEVNRIAETFKRQP